MFPIFIYTQICSTDRNVCCLFRLCSLVSNFLTKSNIKQVMKLQPMMQKTEILVYFVDTHRRIHMYKYSTLKILFALLACMVMRLCLIGSFTAASTPGPDTSLSTSKQKLSDTSRSYPHMDYSPFIRYLPTSVLLHTVEEKQEYKIRMIIIATTP